MSQSFTLTGNRAVVTASRRRLLRGAVGGTVTAAFLAAGWTIDAAARASAVDAGVPAASVDVPHSIIVLFNNPESPLVFEDYYEHTHVPLALGMPMLQSLESCKSVSHIDGREAIFYRMVTLHFASLDHLEQSLASNEGIAAFADVANFASGGATATIVHDSRAQSPALTDASPTHRRIERRTP